MNNKKLFLKHETNLHWFIYPFALLRSENEAKSKAVKNVRRNIANWIINNFQKETNPNFNHRTVYEYLDKHKQPPKGINSYSQDIIALIK